MLSFDSGRAHGCQLSPQFRGGFLSPSRLWTSSPGLGRPRFVGACNLPGRVDSGTIRAPHLLIQEHHRLREAEKASVAAASIRHPTSPSPRPNNRSSIPTQIKPSYPWFLLTHPRIENELLRPDCLSPTCLHLRLTTTSLLLASHACAARISGRWSGPAVGQEDRNLISTCFILRHGGIASFPGAARSSRDGVVGGSSILHSTEYICVKMLP